MPFVGPEAAVPALIDRNVRPLEPMVVLATLRAVPVVVVSVLLDPVTFTVPPPVAAKALLEPVEVEICSGRIAQRAGRTCEGAGDIRERYPLRRAAGAGDAREGRIECAAGEI